MDITSDTNEIQRIIGHPTKNCTPPERKILLLRKGNNATFHITIMAK